MWGGGYLWSEAQYFHVLHYETGLTEDEVFYSFITESFGYLRFLNLYTAFFSARALQPFLLKNGYSLTYIKKNAQNKRCQIFERAISSIFKRINPF